MVQFLQNGHFLGFLAETTNNSGDEFTCLEIRN